MKTKQAMALFGILLLVLPVVSAFQNTLRVDVRGVDRQEQFSILGDELTDARIKTTNLEIRNFQSERGKVDLRVTVDGTNENGNREVVQVIAKNRKAVGEIDETGGTLLVKKATVCKSVRNEMRKTCSTEDIVLKVDLENKEYSIVAEGRVSSLIDSLKGRI